jgi:hypothetical protein
VRKHGQGNAVRERARESKREGKRESVSVPEGGRERQRGRASRENLKKEGIYERGIRYRKNRRHVT